METLAILADTPTAATGFAVVCKNLAENLSKHFRVIYFGRFGQHKEFAESTQILRDYRFEYVPCQGGVWDRELVVRLLKHYDEIDYVFSEDDWFSAGGMLGACMFWEKPFHFLTPVDSLPISKYAFNDIFTNCDKVYIPNRSFEQFNGRKRLNYSPTGKIPERVSPELKSIYLPHGADTDIFTPRKVEREDEFTFIWIGRVEERKAPGRAVQAFEKICNKMDARLFIRTDWNTPNGRRLSGYIKRRNIPVTMDSTEDVPHYEMSTVYNKGDVNLCTAKAGGFEMSILEAAGCGLPSLVTNWTFMNENVVDGKSGFLINIDGNCYPPPSHNPLAKDRIWGNVSVDDLAEKMYWMYLNQKETKLMGRWAQANTEENYSWSKVADTLASEIKE